MTITNSVIALDVDHSGVDEALKEPPMSGSDMKKLTVVGKDNLMEDRVISFFSTEDGMKYWGRLVAFWGGASSLLLGAAFLWMPGLGPLFWVAAHWFDGSSFAWKKLD